MQDAVDILNRRVTELEEQNLSLETEIAELGEILSEGILSKLVEDERERCGFRFGKLPTPLKERANVMLMVYTVTTAHERELEGILDVMRARMVSMHAHVPAHVLDAIVRTHPFPPEPGAEE
jgi:hypothetical protein